MRWTWNIPKSSWHERTEDLAYTWWDSPMAIKQNKVHDQKWTDNHIIYPFTSPCVSVLHLPSTITILVSPSLIETSWLPCTDFYFHLPHSLSLKWQSLCSSHNWCNHQSKCLIPGSWCFFSGLQTDSLPLSRPLPLPLLTPNSSNFS